MIEEATTLLKKSDDDFQPLKTPSTKQRKQLSLPKKNKKLVKLIASKKEMIIKSLNNLHEYIIEAGLYTSPEKIKASLFVTEMTYTPPSKKVGNNKEIGKREVKKK
ncbi:hypothetical protein GLOIN_2v1481859 [Rhizophagus irregularis DAOM 181602=DAOM 197198]|uniref:Uncharacterized protein n=1 Tax=Rhizophagus irregularis (strain DAOM 181602 / DAOM 197198 / MUCL 43194) TaxID=747089 RepID=A0A2P4PNN3_RHIID|nr:hypothetical protein GLOIN_2v1481859 [Rhizophagus irregularis DAOM 181602=DAOM 197198]POG66989.1 hypothetical protein GLOIN_2v1481859 [Rhizophagus irregularis DAOM 181602=DAOM 197198]|eukprot:XP_025173855.1 hypothetical protein GLOIN_2v1481859 [Rhizophagus irregularis DAOM 181602=DAOM 197198]